MRRVLVEYRRHAQHLRRDCCTVVNYYGSITVNYEHELAQLDDQGHRPLRTAATDDPAVGL
ncbi:hypothetical protein ACWCXX_38175 [Streptomyces sp. NPDC001732]